MKKLILLLFVQTLFKWGFSQVHDTVHVQVDSLDFPIPYTLKAGSVILKPEQLDQVVWIITSMNTSITDYKALVLQYGVQDSLQEHQKSLLQMVIITQNQQLDDKQETISDLNRLLETSTSTVDLLIAQQQKSRKDASIRLFAGVTVGVLVGFGVGFLCGF